MNFSYKTKGTCARQIDLEINDNIVTNVVFYGGCDGNLKAIPRLVDGWTADQIADKCSGVLCGFKNTSCADQLAHAVLAAKEAEHAQK
ncbi:MAG TPA: TIGR03905 family TSCPD domain-containing protein [Lachnospiraceae bacterium]|nr:TIGR03905 family TSCPD domain-containing protein [Lachnospiraceae bacterium]